jgi:hypothetical protein
MKLSTRLLLCAWLALALLWLGLALVPDPYYLDIALFGGVPIFFAWLGISMWSLIASLRSVSDEKWLWGAAAFLIIPIAAFYGAVQAIPRVQYPEDYVHFLLERPTYDATVARLPENGERFAEFNWGGMLFASRGVVYDETDQVGLPFGHQSAKWKARMKNTDLTCGGDGPVGEAMSLGHHYYVVSFGC